MRTNNKQNAVASLFHRELDEIVQWIRALRKKHKVLKKGPTFWKHVKNSKTSKVPPSSILSPTADFW